VGGFKVVVPEDENEEKELPPPPNPRFSLLLLRSSGMSSLRGWSGGDTVVFERAPLPAARVVVTVAVALSTEARVAEWGNHSPTNFKTSATISSWMAGR
jgi:hypothetical protein